MQSNWVSDLSLSVRAMESIKTTVLPELISGEILCIENSDNEILLKIDQMSGVDYLRLNDIGIQGIAARVQFGRSWDSFTVRYKRSTGALTEYEKRKMQIEKGYFYPAYTLQAYFDNSVNLNLLSIGIIETKALYEEMQNNPAVVTRTNPSDMNEFKLLFWSDVINKNALKVKRP